jgi:hypothetical protein
MTEAEWLGATDPVKMLGQVIGKAGDRELRLFACATCRRLWHLLRDPRSRVAVEVSERYADGLADEAELRAAARAARLAEVAVRAGGGFWNAAQTAAEAAGPAEAGARRAALAAADADLCREIFGNPFRPPTLDPSWLLWNNGCLRVIAQGIYEERRFDDLPVLADALSDSGCQDETLLAHCRGGGRLYRGCWLLDRILAAGMDRH